MCSNILFTFSIAFGAFVAYPLWFTRAFGDKTSTYAIIGALAVGMMMMMSFVIDAMLRSLSSKLVTFDSRRADGWTLGTKKAEIAAGRHDDLVAVQLAAARAGVVPDEQIGWDRGQLVADTLPWTGSTFEMTATGCRRSRWSRSTPVSRRWAPSHSRRWGFLQRMARRAILLTALVLIGTAHAQAKSTRH